MDKDKSIERGIIKYVWLYAIVVSLILLIFAREYIVYFILGVASNLLGFTLTIKVIDRSLYNENVNTKRAFVVNNLLKLLLYTSVLTVVAISTEGNPRFIIATFIGMLSVKLMIYFKSIIVEPLKRKKGGVNKDE